ncbi:ankyrin repeat and protein kinase domain-containing protein 1-like isoform X1 [Haliotis asinina]|uniref:ankyrin repeat and protein kinase domain-containing protein 1-like isoform X1 n=1 Tax=Haliotis asinina TaxID=109174 RepID=UPI00353230AA
MEDRIEALTPSGVPMATVVLETPVVVDQSEMDNSLKFYRALIENDMNMVEHLVKNEGVHIDMIFMDGFTYVQPTFQGWGALHIVTRRGLGESLKFLVSLGADVFLSNKDGDTALHIASRYGHVQCVEFLLDCDIRLKDYVNNQGLTPLIRAVFKFEHAFKGQYRKTVKALLSAGCDTNICSLSKVTPLHLAAGRGDAYLSKMLIDGGADVNAICSQGSSPLLKALYALRVNLECVKVLLEAKADVNIATISGRTVLHLAISKCDEECVEAILKAGADPNAQDNYGKTPLWIAVQENNIRFVPIVARYGGNVNYNLPPQNLSLLSLAITCQSTNMVKLLLEHGASVDTETIMQASPLSLSVEALNIPIIKALLRHNCHLNVVGNARHSLIPQSPIQIAFELGNLEIIRLLMRAGCKVKAVWLTSQKLPPVMMNNQSLLQWVESYFYSVPSLMHLARLCIREILGPDIQPKLEQLSQQELLPRRVLDYLLLEDILEDTF